MLEPYFIDPLHAPYSHHLCDAILLFRFVNRDITTLMNTRLSADSGQKLAFLFGLLVLPSFGREAENMIKRTRIDLSQYHEARSQIVGPQIVHPGTTVQNASIPYRD